MHPRPPTNSERDPLPNGGKSLRQQYAAIIDDTQAALIQAARRLCGVDEDWAQDLVQEAFVRGYMAFVEGSFAFGSNARQWLVRILTNLFINDYHKRRRTDVGASDDSVELTADKHSLFTSKSQRPEIVAMEKVLDETIELAIGQLGPDVRAAVLLVDVEGLDYVVAAESLGISQGTLRTRLSRGRVRLHDLLQDYVRAHGIS